MDEKVGGIPNKLHSTTDAMVWAKEFINLITTDQTPDDHESVTYIEVDENLMLGWFANAIETGRSAGFKRGYEEAMNALERSYEANWPVNVDTKGD